MSIETHSRSDARTTEFSLSLRARDAKTSAAIAFAAALPAAFLAFQWHALAVLPVAALFVGARSVRTLVAVAAEHSRNTHDHDDHATSH